MSPCCTICSANQWMAGMSPRSCRTDGLRLGHQRPRILEGLLQEGIHLGERRPDLRGSVIETLESLT